MSDYRTKTVSLPGGRVIRIVYFSRPDGDDASGNGGPGDGSASPAAVGMPPEPAASASLARHEADEPRDDLHVCPACEGELVYPVAWEEQRAGRWRIALRCPDCEWRGGGEFGQDEVEHFDDVEQLIRAIHGDQIEPMDF